MAVQRGHLLLAGLMDWAVLVIPHVESICWPPRACGRSRQTGAGFPAVLSRAFFCKAAGRAELQGPRGHGRPQKAGPSSATAPLCLLHRFPAPPCETGEHSVLVGKEICQKQSKLSSEYSLKIINRQTRGMKENDVTLSHAHAL